ncbi:CarD family transcriptional regulator [Caldibacillus lycopersici]|uniref:CarD family transcriptional regulator n=1 Tax=Perspicuibacillus lycopersici TaxID=1325689 RepID=A0AAE3IQF6_9BACI|nr:CarD family transcriptional regulator [Perspicuibacillus lycopersici]MCU9612668.1 CarD family transcriptional regulator [Perspicuibacillus lycopersici]
MLKIGDLIIYAGHGICRIDEICDKTYAGITKTYYVLHPIENNQQLTISTPVDNETAIMHLMDQEEANHVLQSFYSDGVDWIEKTPIRGKVYSNIINSRNRLEIAKLANTLLRKKYELEKDGKKLYELDSKLLLSIQSILFKELALAYNISTQAILEKIETIIINNEKMAN